MQLPGGSVRPKSWFGMGDKKEKKCKTMVVLESPFSACKLEIGADKLYNGVEKSIHFH